MLENEKWAKDWGKNKSGREKELGLENQLTIEAKKKWWGKKIVE